MTLYGYARVSVREPADKNLDLQVERLVRAGCAAGNIRAEEASGAKNDRGGLLELLELVEPGDTLMVTHIDRLSRGLIYGLQVIEGLQNAGVEFRSLSEDFDTTSANGKLQLQMVLAFSEWWRNSIRERSIAGQEKARAEGRFPGRKPVLTEQQRAYVRDERSAGVSQKRITRDTGPHCWPVSLPGAGLRICRVYWGQRWARSSAAEAEGVVAPDGPPGRQSGQAEPMLLETRLRRIIGRRFFRAAWIQDGGHGAGHPVSDHHHDGLG